MIANLPIFILCWVCLITYGVIGPRLFRPPKETKIIRAKDLLFYLFVGMHARAAWHAVFYGSSYVLELAGVLIGGGGLGLFQWAYRQHKAQKPGRAFTPDVPEILVTSGPYSRIRHPVYAAYILSFLGMIVGTMDGVLALAWLLLVVLYFKAAKIEDRLLEQSVHASICRLYQQQSGLLLPWNFWRPKKV